MVTKVVMPRLSLTMKEGSVGKWYRKKGDTVMKDEPLLEVVSEKATYDVEAPVSGILQRILVEAGSDAPVDGVLAIITAPGESYVETEIQHEASPAITPGKAGVLASPAAKRLAREYGVDLSLVEGSGPEGRIIEEDVQRFTEKRGGESPKIKKTIPLAGLRKTSAERLSMSFRTAPHSTVFMEIDVSKASTIHKELKVSYTAILVKAVANALIEHPAINASLNGNGISIFEDANVGVAVATENGLLVPVIRNADRKSIREIDVMIAELTEKAKRGGLTIGDMSNGTFTVTNLGMHDVDMFIPIINPPEAAILGAGKINEKPVFTGGKIEIRPMIMLSLTYDHRIVDGAPASEFLQKVKEEIEKPPAEN